MFAAFHVVESLFSCESFFFLFWEFFNFKQTNVEKRRWIKCHFSVDSNCCAFYNLSKSYLMLVALLTNEQKKESLNAFWKRRKEKQHNKRKRISRFSFFISSLFKKKMQFLYFFISMLWELFYVSTFSVTFFFFNFSTFFLTLSSAIHTAYFFFSWRKEFLACYCWYKKFLVH